MIVISIQNDYTNITVLKIVMYRKAMNVEVSFKSFKRQDQTYLLRSYQELEQNFE